MKYRLLVNKYRLSPVYDMFLVYNNNMKTKNSSNHKKLRIHIENIEKLETLTFQSMLFKDKYFLSYV